MKKQFDLARNNAICSIALGICNTVRAMSHLLTFEEVKTLCTVASKYCETHGCQEASSTCRKASEAKTEKKWEEFCKMFPKVCPKVLSGMGLKEQKTQNERRTVQNRQVI